MGRFDAGRYVRKRVHNKRVYIDARVASGDVYIVIGYASESNSGVPQTLITRYPFFSVSTLKHSDALGPLPDVDTAREALQLVHAFIYPFTGTIDFERITQELQLCHITRTTAGTAARS